MGGRLDATTVGVPEAEVVTHIDYDHQAYLGATLAAIAAEKAAIIRSGVAFSARQEPEAMAVLERRAARGRACRSSSRGATSTASRARRHAGRPAPGPGRARLAPRRRACRAARRASSRPTRVLAAAAARRLGADEAAIRRGLAAVEWPGRFQIVGAGARSSSWTAPTIPDGARALARSLAEYFPGQAVTLVIGDLRGQGPARHPRGARAARRPPHPDRRTRARAPRRRRDLARHLPPAASSASRSRPRRARP